MCLKAITPVYWISDGLLGNLSVTCGSPSDAPTTIVSSETVSTTTLTHASSPLESSVDSTSVVNTIENTYVTLSSSTINVSYDSLTMESAQDDQEMLCKYEVDHLGFSVFNKFLIICLCL